MLHDRFHTESAKGEAYVDVPRLAKVEQELPSGLELCVRRLVVIKVSKVDIELLKSCERIALFFKVDIWKTEEEIGSPCQANVQTFEVGSLRQKGDDEMWRKTT